MAEISKLSKGSFSDGLNLPPEDERMAAIWFTVDGQSKIRFRALDGATEQHHFVLQFCKSVEEMIAEVKKQTMLGNMLSREDYERGADS